MRVESFVFGCGEFISLDDLKSNSIERPGMALVPHGIAFVEGMFAGRGRGNSMEPGFPNGSWGIFYPVSVEPMGASCILVEYNNGSGRPSYILKKFSVVEVYQPDGTWERTDILLLSTNKEHPPIRLSEHKDYRQVGWLVRCVPEIQRCETPSIEPVDNI